MNLLFNLDDVICTPPKGMNFGITQYIANSLPIEDTNEFMRWCKEKKHHITIWCERENTLEMKMMTEDWLYVNQIPYDRLLFDRPTNPIFVDDTPPNARYFETWGDNDIVSRMFEEWKKWITETEVE